MFHPKLDTSQITLLSSFPFHQIPSSVSTLHLHTHDNLSLSLLSALGSESHQVTEDAGDNSVLAREDIYQGQITHVMSVSLFTRHPLVPGLQRSTCHGHGPPRACKQRWVQWRPSAMQAGTTAASGPQGTDTGETVLLTRPEEA